jgi:GTP pyrophosphokinase
MNPVHVASLSLESLLEALPDLSPGDRLLIERAYRKAEAAHDGQLRKSGEPYFTHCIEVALILAEMKLDAEAIAAALMHDLIEDTEVTFDQIKDEFGRGVAEIVDGVTKFKTLAKTSVDGVARAKNDRELEYIRKMAMAMGNDVRVVIVKLADRLHNMRTLGYMSPERQRAIAQETLDIFAPLANRLGIWQFKWELEDLSFRYLAGDKYKMIAAQLDERRVDRENYLQQVTATLRKELAQYELTNVTITGRPKHIFSIYKKMERKRVDFDQVYDVRAVRVIVDSIPQCYLVLGVVHNLWRPIPGEFDDYIAAPKDNFYRSLHTAVVDSSGKTLEVQIRTWDMHEHAEYGIAAHWRYKEGGKGKRDEEFQKRLNFLRRLMEFGSEENDPASFVATMKTEVFQDRVYAFTPKGDIVDLPKGATPLDFAYHIHTDLGHRCRGAKVHGRTVPLNYVLQMGDQIEIQVEKRGGPSLDWLNPELGYVTTNRAKSKIRYYFRKQNRDKHIVSGRDVLERELKRLGVLGSMSFETIVGWFGYENLDDFLAAVGAGDINGSQIANRILEHERREQEARERETLVAHPARATSGGSLGISVSGTNGMLYTFARCCNPVLGDPIMGYVTRGRGLSVHRADCPNISREPERLIAVSWGLVDRAERYSVPVEIIAYDRKELLRDISTVISDESINMSQVNVQTKNNIATLYLTLELADMQQLTRILSRLENVDQVVEARRRGIV